MLGDGGIIYQAELATKLQQNATIAEEEAMNEYKSILGETTTNGETYEGTAADLVGSAENILGATVNYDTGTELATDITWRVFYIDESNIYLIAADYVLAEDAPETSSGYSPISSEDYPYVLYLYNVYSDYAGSADWDSTVSYWNTLYLASYPSSTNSNAIAVAYLLDTSLWNTNFAQSNYAEYAIGSPTLEMWVASWNQHGYTTLYCNNINSHGYYIGTEDTPTSFCQYVSEDYVDNSGYDDTLYFPHQSTWNSCRGYWLASPAAGTWASYDSHYGGSLFFVNYYCNVDCWNYKGAVVSFRPVVCLSAEVCLTLEEDGTYSIN